jgi:dihydropteroate synthase
MILEHARGRIESDFMQIMGTVNRTPDSFYDGGRTGLSESVDFALSMMDEGADILDLGGVKAGPGEDVSEEEESRRLVPLVEELAQRTDAPLSIETARPGVARRALDAGAAIINDVSGLADPELAAVAAERNAALVVMHHGGQIRGRPRNPRYDDVVRDVSESLTELAQRAREAGVAESSIVVDPGLDFGKTTMHSLILMRRLPELKELAWPLLIAPSRKDVVGETLGLPVDERLEGTLALVALSAAADVDIVRVHDVRAAIRVASMVEAVAGKRRPRSPIRGLWE